jgi:hypothetical protein
MAQTQSKNTSSGDTQESQPPNCKAEAANDNADGDEPSAGGLADAELLLDALSVPAMRAEAERVFERAAARGLFGEREVVAVLERRRVAALVAAGVQGLLPAGGLLHEIRRPIYGFPVRSFGLCELPAAACQAQEFARMSWVLPSPA